MPRRQTSLCSPDKNLDTQNPAAHADPMVVKNGRFGPKKWVKEGYFFINFSLTLTSSTFRKLVKPSKKVFAHLIAIWTDENSTARTDPMVVKNGRFTHITHLSNTLDRGLPH